MPSETHAMISIHPKFVDSILAGIKTVEIRRRFIDLPEGSTLWIYSTLPVGAIVAVATLSSIDHDTPNRLWRKHRSHVGVLKNYFNSYFNACSFGVAITLSDVQQITPLNLEKIRAIRGVDYIPQVAVRVSKQEAEEFSKFSQRIRA